MEKIKLLFIGFLISGFVSHRGTVSSDEPCLTKAEAEKILGLPARQMESTTVNRGNVVQRKCSWKVTEDELNSNLYYIDEQYDNAEAAHKVFEDIVTSNTNSGQSRPNIGDEAWFHSDGTNFCIIIVRKANKMIRMKVNRLTKDTSVEEMKRVAIEWK